MTRTSLDSRPIVLLACALLAASPGARAEDDDLLASSREAIRSTTLAVAREVDSWFGDQPFANGGGVHDGRLSLRLVQQPGQAAHFGVGFDARLRLPNLERHGYLFIGRDNADEVVADTPQAASRRERLIDERSDAMAVFAGLGVRLREALELRVGVRGGLKPYAQGRWRRAATFGPQGRDRFELRQTAFWSLRDRLGSTTALSLEHEATTTVSLRWLSSATITQASQGWGWNSIAGVVKSLGPQRSVSLEGLITGQRDDVGRVMEAGLQLRGTRPVHNDWLLGQATVGRYWPVGTYRPEAPRRWAVGFGAVMLF